MVNDVEEEEEEPEDVLKVKIWTFYWIFLILKVIANILKADADSEDIEDLDSCCEEPRC